MKCEGSSTWSLKTISLSILPLITVLLSLMVWIAAVSHSGFWADDFLNVTHFARSLGNLSDDRINDGHYIINVFWAVGTLAFGSGSVVPFLMLNTLVFVVGIVTWLWVGVKARWGSLEAWWIGALFIATAAWLQTTLWSSNITHSGGFLALGVGLLAHERCMRARTFRGGILWSLASGAAWTAAVVSNILYIGLLVIASYCAFHQVLKILSLRRGGTAGVAAAVGFWNLAVPVIFFLAVAYPATTASSPYAANGLRFIHQNLDFYRTIFAPTTLLMAVYILVLLVGFAGGVAALRRRDWFPITVLVAAGATAVPALVQSQQREMHYMAMPLLLVFSAAAAGVRPVLAGRSKQLVWPKGVILLVATAVLLLIFRQGAEFRSYFVESPYGASLAVFRSDVASLTPEGGTICATLDLDPQDQKLLIAEMSGTNGFMVPPINAAQVYMVSAGKACPDRGPASHIAISLDTRGDFVAAG